METMLVQAEVTPEDRLRSLLERAPDLEPYLNRIQVTRIDYVSRIREFEREGNDSPAEEGLLTGLHHPAFVEDARWLDQQQMFKVFEDIATVTSTINKGKTLDEQWPEIMERLLDHTPTDGPDRQLFAAFAVSLLSQDRQLRRTFVRRALELDVQTKLSSQLRDSDLTIIHADNQAIPHSYRFRGLAYAFEAPKDSLRYYLDYTEHGPHNPDHPTLKPKLLQRQLVEAYKNDSVQGADLAHAEAASKPRPELWQESMVDPHKVERFALEQIIIEEQRVQLFPNENLLSSPFAALLRSKGRVRGEHTIEDLQDDIVETFAELSKPVKEKYCLSETADRAELTRAQQIALRYSHLMKHSSALGHIGQYLDIGGTHIAISSTLRITDIAEQGAAVPQQIRLLLANVVGSGYRYGEQTGNFPTEAELLAVALRNRKHLIRKSMMNIQDFSAMQQKHDWTELSFTGTRSDLYEGEVPARMYEGAHGYEIEIPLAREPNEGQATRHNGVTLGCPAGRVSMDGLRHSVERGTEATNNLIDYVVEVSLHEAYRRGLFDLNMQQRWMIPKADR